jgi:hypothetical protein
MDAAWLFDEKTPGRYIETRGRQVILKICLSED